MAKLLISVTFLLMLLSCKKDYLADTPPAETSVEAAATPQLITNVNDCAKAYHQEMMRIYGVKNGMHVIDYYIYFTTYAGAAYTNYNDCYYNSLTTGYHLGPYDPLANLKEDYDTVFNALKPVYNEIAFSYTSAPFLTFYSAQSLMTTLNNHGFLQIINDAIKTVYTANTNYLSMDPTDKLFAFFTALGSDYDDIFEYTTGLAPVANAYLTSIAFNGAIPLDVATVFSGYLDNSNEYIMTAVPVRYLPVTPGVEHWKMWNGILVYDPLPLGPWGDMNPVIPSEFFNPDKIKFNADKAQILLHLQSLGHTLTQSQDILDATYNNLGNRAYIGTADVESFYE